MHNLVRCHVQAGPVSGATLVDGAEACTLMVTTHQLRLHHTHDTAVYTCVGSDPIIEHCSAIRFAPLPELPYAQYASHLQSAGVTVDNGKWQSVQDFQCPGHRVSPNWTVAPVAERVAPLTS
jgi:tubulin-specific chaperone C